MKPWAIKCWACMYRELTEVSAEVDVLCTHRHGPKLCRQDACPIRVGLLEAGTVGEEDDGYPD